MRAQRMDEDYSSDSEDEFRKSFAKTALAFSSDYDVTKYDPTSGPPSCGDDFLKYVMHETAQCEEIVTAKLENIEISEPTWSKMESSFAVDTPKDLIPTIKWQLSQLEEFNCVRERVEEIRTRGIIHTDQSAQPLEHYASKEPLLTNVMSLREPCLCCVLKQIAYDVMKLSDGESIPRRTGVWLYSVLATLATPLLPDTCFKLREIARRCIQLRASLTKPNRTSENINVLNLFVCIIARYFNQIDLAD